ncbi:MAG: PIN domain-containing protein [Jatrophihabitans sp.]|nr:MAG: PIN domain-containing protein [Jatrophihabitans sp.]
MTAFADSSAIVKLYADEDGHQTVRRSRDLLVSVLARVEVPAAIWRKQRAGELSSGHATVLTADFEADFFGDPTTAARFTVVAVTAAILDGAARACAVHGLRAYDAIQLASATAVRAAVPDCTTFAAFDRSLRAAAAAEGFALLPADLPGSG